MDINSIFQGNMTPYGQMQPQGYPTLPNQYGIGAQIDSTGGGGSGIAPYQQGSQVGAGTQVGSPGGPAGPVQQPNLTQAPAQNGSNGFNPWSLTGEANARST